MHIHSVIELAAAADGFYKLGELPGIIASARHPSIATAWTTPAPDDDVCTAEAVTILSWQESRQEFHERLYEDARAGKLCVLSANGFPLPRGSGPAILDAGLVAILDLVEWGRALGFEFTVSPQTDEQKATAESGKKKVERAVPAGLSSGAVARIFDGVYFNEAKWSDYLTDRPDWLRPALLVAGRRGGKDPRQAMWNPCELAMALLLNKRWTDKSDNEKIAAIDARFRAPELHAWRDEWAETRRSKLFLP